MYIGVIFSHQIVDVEYVPLKLKAKGPCENKSSSFQGRKVVKGI